MTDTREREYAVVIHESWIGERISDDVPLCEPDDEKGCWETARACVAVEDRHTAALLAEVTRLRGVILSMLGTFVHPTHPGRECLQSGHVPVERVAEWSAALRGPATPAS